MSDDLFFSGRWVGYYSYSDRPRRHQMELALEFGNGRITGEGRDDIGPFVISGRYENEQCWWTKSYIGKHDVYYQGSCTGKGISGAWEIGRLDRGCFRIWPQAHSDGRDDSVSEEVEQPVDAVGELVNL